MSTVTKHSAPKLDRAVQGFAKSFAENIQMGMAWNKVTFGDMLQNRLLLVYAIRKGLPYSMFELIAEQSPFTVNDWVQLLDLSLKSMQRYKADDRDFKPIHSEKILEIAEVTRFGLEVFGDMDKFKLWLNTPSFALGKMKPIDLLGDSFGKEMVMTELNRIEYGIFV
jgi:putative toxin-antitoxin system antitoxin component (TIGR02293 family)